MRSNARFSKGANFHAFAARAGVSATAVGDALIIEGARFAYGASSGI